VNIEKEERLSRFIFSSNHYRKSDNIIKPAAFMPAPNKTTSVFRTSNLNDSDIWTLGERYVVPKRQKPIVGRGDISSEDVFNIGLSVVPNEPPELHADIEDWPEEKSHQKLRAIELAQAAGAMIKPED
jgi:hypothetical protein